jgi:hypothetical protein
VLTTCQPSTVWCSRERLPAAAAQPAKVRQSCSATDYYYYIFNLYVPREQAARQKTVNRINSTFTPMINYRDYQP